VRWAEFETDAGWLGEVARARLAEPGVVLVATIRADGSPRVSPCEPFFLDADLWLPMLWHSRKADDLRRDARVLVHSIITHRDGDEGEVKARGRAIPESRRTAEVCRAIGAALPFEPDPARVDLFSVDVESVVHIAYATNGDQHVSLWPARRRFVRRETSATSVGEPEDLPFGR
jgi:hypothetical protein